MKTHLFNTIVLTAALLASNLNSNAEQLKKVHKSWPVSNVTSLAIQNKFGNINFVNSRNDSVVIDVVVDTDMSTRIGYRIAEQINFEFSFSEGKVFARTVFNEGFRTKQEFTVNYVINIPANKSLQVDNKYGNVTLDNLNADGSFEIAYGNISGNNLNTSGEEKIKLELKYGSASFESINRFFGNISYSKFRCSDLEKANLETRYSTLFVEKSKEIFANSRYDNYTIIHVDKINADTKFTDWKIEKVTTSFTYLNEYGDIKVGYIPKNFEKVMIQNQYGNIRVGIANDASYHLRGESWYCNINFPKNDVEKYIKEDNHTLVEAYIGSRNSTSRVNIESKYGKVDLME